MLGGTAGRSAINCPTAAKTGTTSELVDAWLDGYTPNYSTVVWMGYPNKRVSMTDVHGEPQQGGYLPAEIWHAYMAAVTEGQSCTEFPSAETKRISYKPFYGKFASTGPRQIRQAPKAKKQQAPKKKHARATTPDRRPTAPGPAAETARHVRQRRPPRCRKRPLPNGAARDQQNRRRVARLRARTATKAHRAPRW